jgi:hypothetical protein
MKYLTAPKLESRATNCGGPDQSFWEQLLEVEAEDVGRSRPDYLGHRRPGHVFTENDVGRHIISSQQGSEYKCWWFKT